MSAAATACAASFVAAELFVVSFVPRMADVVVDFFFDFFLPLGLGTGGAEVDEEDWDDWVGADAEVVAEEDALVEEEGT